jgi:hypothetical protein
VKYTWEAVTEPGYLALFLELARVHLPLLTSLHLYIYNGEIAWRENTALWDTLARFSQLQSIVIDTDPVHPQSPEYKTEANMETPLPLRPVQVLSSITSLSSLTIKTQQAELQDGYNFLRSLTTLTHLELPLDLKAPIDYAIPVLDPADLHAGPPTSLRVSPFTALSNLRSLAFSGRNYKEATSGTLTASECSCLAQLTSLTKLHVMVVQVLAWGSLLPQLLSPLHQLQVS